MGKVRNLEVKPETLGANAQTCHKIIQLTLKTLIGQEKNVRKVQKKFKHCSAEALIKVKGEVAKKCKILRILRGERPPNIYTYNTISRIYNNAKVKYVEYRRGRKKVIPLPMVVRTMQAKINQTRAQIEQRNMKNEKDRKNGQVEELINRYQILETELYKIWRNEEHRRWAQWIKN